MVKKWVIGVLVIAAIVAGIWWYQQSFKSKPIEVETVVVEKKNLDETVSGSGFIQADRQVEVLPPSADEITKIYISEGDNVEEDDDLIKLKNTGKIEAPIDGRIVQLSAAVGQTAIPGKPLIVIADFDPTYFVANIDEADIARVSPGQKASIVLDAYPEETLLGEVSEIGMVSQSTAAGGTAFSVKIRLTDSKGVTLRLGMNGDTDITVGMKEAVVAVPLEGVTSRDGKDIAFVVENKKVKKRIVTLGLVTGDSYEVVEGLDDGDRLVIKGLSKLKGGEKVK